jgi:glycosyltransferase involved in cell wall biosynthesis
MRVSIITACLNAGPSIHRTIASIKAQDHDDTEWIVIDGGSKDGTLEALQNGEYSPHILVSERDEGIADAFNKGLSHASGEAVWFMNAGDEFASSDCISGLVRDWNRDRYRWIMGAAETVAADGSVLFIRRWSTQPSNPRSLIRWNNQISHQAVLAERALFPELGKFDSSFRIAMDYELWLRWILHGIEPQCSPRLVCRFHRGGVSGDPMRNHREFLRARALHGAGLGPLGEGMLCLLAWIKARIRGRYGRSIYRLKERLGLRI